MSKATLIDGNKFEDSRGSLRFFNTLDMSEIVRLYEIFPASENTIRAWQGHKMEKKWMYCISGSFIINLVELDDFKNPSDQLTPIRVELFSDIPKILEVPNGYASGIRAKKPNSRLQVFSNFGLDESKKDDYRYPLEQWSAKW